MVIPPRLPSPGVSILGLGCMIQAQDRDWLVSNGLQVQACGLGLILLTERYYVYHLPNEPLPRIATFNPSPIPASGPLLGRAGRPGDRDGNPGYGICGGGLSGLRDRLPNADLTAV